MVDIVISYRRDDTKWIAGRIFDRLEDHYGSGHVFMDIDSIPVGLDFRRHIDATLRRCDILLALIGPKWAGDFGDGKSRINDVNDWVRIEIESALRKNIPVVPTLIDSCPMPKSSDLPDTLRDLSFRHAAQIDSGLDFRSHMERLIRSIDKLVEDRKADKAAPSSSGNDSDSFSKPPGLKRSMFIARDLLLAFFILFVLASVFVIAGLTAAEKFGVSYHP
jgi:hypothetical protein